MTGNTNIEDLSIENKFTRKLLDLAVKILKRELRHVDKNDFYKSLESSILGKKYELSKANNKILNEKERFIINVFREFSEIDQSLKNLKTTIVLTRTLRGKKQLKNYELLKYYFENFINEIHLYSLRVTRVLNIIIKKTKMLKLDNERTLIEENKKDFLECFKGLTKIRNAHIHEERYKDSKFSQLEDLDFFKNIEIIKNLPVFTEYSKSVFRKNKKFYLSSMEENIRNIKTITDKCLEEIYDIFFGVILDNFSKQKVYKQVFKKQIIRYET